MSLFTRLLTGSALTAVMAATGAVPAYAETSANCFHDGSIRLFTANDGDYKVWIDEIRSGSGWDEIHLCYAAKGVLGGDIVVRYPVRGTLTPTVVPDLDDDNCPRLFELQDPVQLMTRLYQSLSETPAYLCFGVADVAYRVSFTLPAPQTSFRIGVFLDKGNALTDAYCALTEDPDCTDATLPYVRVD